MAVNYFWNIALSEALYASFAALEVTLRSSIHREITIREGTEMWFRSLLEPKQLRDFAAASVTLHEHRKVPNPTSGQIVAELTFGFWTTILSQPYHQKLWTPKNASLLKAVFPNLPPTPNNRHFVHQRCNELRLLRNRVMHHEPVWSRPNLREEHMQMIEAIGWMSSIGQASIQLIDHFPDTFQNGRSNIERDIRKQFNF